MKRVLFALTIVIGLSFQQSNAQQVAAAFSAATTRGCAPLDSVQFTDQSTGGVTSWLWNFGNGNTSTFRNPQASFPNPGVYTVTLTVSNGVNSDTEVKTGYITVYRIPVANFNFTPAFPCVGLSVTFTDNSTLGDAPLTIWAWGFGDGNTQTVSTNSVIHGYTFPLVSATASVIVTDTNGCESDFNKPITILPLPKAGFSASPLPVVSCSSPFTVTFTDTSIYAGPVSYQWYFGDGSTSTAQNPQHTYTATGNYSVSLVITQGSCSDSINKPDYVKVINFQSDFAASDSTVCAGAPITFNETTLPPSVAYSWDFGDGSTSQAISPVHSYSQAGVYTVSMVAVDANGCIDTVVKPNFITVNATPTANFTVSDSITCLYPFSITLSSLSLGATTWSWNFGDGGTSSLQNPPHTYQSPGFYNVSLVVTNANGCSDSLTKINYISIVPPVADFTIVPKKGCVPLDVNFSSTSNSPDPITNYTWTYGDGTAPVTGAASFSNHTYTAAGIYTVTLAIVTQQGCRDTIVKTDSVYVGTPVNPSFTISNDTVCYKDSIQFNLTTPGANSWTWIFGDGSLDSLNHDPIHVYGNPGTYTVTLVACNNGCCDTLVVPDLITILPPKAQFSITSTCTDPLTVICTDQSIEADSIVWDFHDGTIVSNVNPVNHTYASLGLQSVTLHAYNFSSGCQDSITLTYTLTDPITRFTSDTLSGCFPLIVTFQDTSQDAYNHTWDFGDGSAAVSLLSATVSHTYNLPGYYTVKEIITDIHGCTDSLTKTDYIHVYGPYVGFTVNRDTGCAPLSVTFTDTTRSEYPIAIYIWNYGDGSPLDTVSTLSVNHTYVNPANYNVTHIVQDSQGCRNSVLKNNYIRSTYPYPRLTVDTFSCPGKAITFNASSTIAVGGVYFWDFGDGDTLTTLTSTTTHTYASNGNYIIKLNVTDRNNCDSTIFRNILIEQPDANFNSVSLQACGNTKASFYNLSTGVNITSVQWFFGDGGQSFNPDSAFNNYVASGVYNVTLVVTNSAGCIDTLTKDSLIVVPGPIGSFDFAPKDGCNPLTVTFTGSSPNTINYTWDFGDGTVITTSDSVVTHTYTRDLVAQPILTLSSFIPNTTILCEIAAPVIGDSLVTVTTNIDATIAVDGNPNVITVEASEGDQIQLTLSTNIGNPTYNWIPASGLSCSDCSNPVLSGSGSDITYYAEVIDDAGCKGVDSIFVKFIPCETGMIVPNIFTPNGDGINDYFGIFHPCKNFKLLIFNRWGQEVYSSNNPAIQWDGRTNGGEFVPDGTYYWIINTNETAMKGFVEVLKEKKLR